jgi:YVTN family beta-propeller protein
MAATALLPWDNAHAGTAYFANASSPAGSMGILDLTTNKVIGNIPKLNGPDFLVISPDGSKIYANEAENVAVISTKTNKVIANIPIPPSAYGLVPALNPSGTRLYLSSGNGSLIYVIDTTANKVIDTIKFKAGEWAAGLTISPDGKKGYVNFQAGGCTGGLTKIFDTATDKVTGSIKVGACALWLQAAHTPSGNRLYVTDTPYIDVIDTDTDKIIAKVPVEQDDDPWYIAFNPSGTRAYVVDQTYELFYVIDTASNKLLATIQLSSGYSYEYTQTIAVSNDGSRVYVTQNTGIFGHPGIFVIDATTNKQIDFIKTNRNTSSPTGIVTTPLPSSN